MVNRPDHVFKYSLRPQFWKVLVRALHLSFRDALASCLPEVKTAELGLSYLAGKLIQWPEQVVILII